MKRISAALAVLLALTAPALAQTTATYGESQVGGTNCTPNQNSADFDTVAQCNASSGTGTFQKAPVFVGTVTSPPYSATTCDSSKAGMLQWTGTEFQGCDGVSWKTLSISTCDNSPAYPSFENQRDLTFSTLTNSNIVQITGLDASCDIDVGVSGSGSPEYRVCSDSSCSTVTTDWTSSNNTLDMKDQYLELRATTASTEATSYTITVTLGPVSADWTIDTGASGCTPEGTVCSDGTVYAGISGAGTAMYTTQCDLGQTYSGGSCTGTRTTYCWNHCDNTGYTTTSATSTADGQANTATIITVDSDSSISGTQPHDAAQACADLSVDGYSDWYLPSQNEVSTLSSNEAAIGGFDSSGTEYWSSTETYYNDASHESIYNGTSAGGSNPAFKVNSYNVRCVRR